MAATLTFRPARPGDEAPVQRLVDSVLREYAMQLDIAGTDRDLLDLHASYTARGGAFVVLVDDAGAIVGCGGVYRVSDALGEIRKMYLVPAVRGHGYGLALLETIVQAARERRFTRLQLETKSTLVDAIALYQRYGFTEVVHEHMSSRCDRAFAMDLDVEDDTPRAR